MGIILKITFYIFIIFFILSFLLIYSNTHPPRYPLHIPPSNYGLHYENIEFTTPDKIILKGWFIKGITPSVPLNKGGFRVLSPVIIICHGLGANKSDFTEFASTLSKEGYHVLLFDFRGHGESGGRGSSLGFLEQIDLKGAIEYVKSRADVNRDKIGVYGFSLGAAVAILTVSSIRQAHDRGENDVKAVVSDSSFTSLKSQGERVLKSSFLPEIPFLYIAIKIYEIMFRTDIQRIAPVNFIGKLSPTPVFIIGGERDEQMPASDAEELFKNAREPKFLWIIKDAFHGGTISSADREYEKRVIEFFDKYIQ
jgi:alpha-beta hydrolase superfamily lysophospholipase